MTCKSSTCLPKRASGSSLPRMSLVSLMTFCAASWLFQKVSPVICASSSARRWFNLATSKKPPQVRELVGGGGDLRFDDVEHGGGAYRSQQPESSSESRCFCRRCRHRFHSRRNLKYSHSKKQQQQQEITPAKDILAKLYCPAVKTGHACGYRSWPQWCWWRFELPRWRDPSAAQFQPGLCLELAGEKFLAPLRTSKPTGIGLVGWVELFELPDAGRLVFAVPAWLENSWLPITGGDGVLSPLTGGIYWTGFAVAFRRATARPKWPGGENSLDAFTSG